MNIFSAPVDDIKSIIQEYENLNDEGSVNRDVNKVHQFLDNAIKKVELPFIIHYD